MNCAPCCLIRPANRLLCLPADLRRMPGFKILLGAQEGHVHHRDIDPPDRMATVFATPRVLVGQGMAKMATLPVRMSLDNDDALTHSLQTSSPFLAGPAGETKIHLGSLGRPLRPAATGMPHLLLGRES